jgi:hypothetical protein
MNIEVAGYGFSKRGGSLGWWAGRSFKMKKRLVPRKVRVMRSEKRHWLEEGTFHAFSELRRAHKME